MKQINIMTSCDDNLAKYIMPQLISIHLNMPAYDIQFFLFHYRISDGKIKLLKEYAKLLRNITFHEIIIENVAEFEEIAKYGGRFPAEAYIYLHCHNQLPEDTERILYIDAGDVIIHGDISEYYFDDFEGKSFIITPHTVAKTEPDNSLRPFDKDDLNNPEHMEILRTNYVNSGCIVLNIKKLRTKDGTLMTHYLHIVEKIRNMKLKPVQGVEGVAFLGDQGVLGPAFVEDMKIFGYEKIIKHMMHTWPGIHSNTHIQNMYIPYNFIQGSVCFDDACECIPVVLHYASPQPKPWVKKYTAEEMKGIEQRRLPLYKIWWQYCSLTPLALPDSENFTLRLEAHDKNFAQINPLQHMASWHLVYKRYNEALGNINTGLSLATKESNSFHALWQLKVRAFMENENDPLRYEKSLEVINEYFSQITRPTGMAIYMYSYKGYCFQQTGNYNEAIAAYAESYNLMNNYIASEYTGDLILFPIDPTVITEKNWVEACAPANMHYPKVINGVENDRRVRTRTPIPNSKNERHIAECYIYLKNYDEAFRWANRIALVGGDDVKNYFRLINESGQGTRVIELFHNIEKLRDKHKILDECLAVFDEIVLPHPNATNIIAPFVDKYNELSAERLERLNCKKQ